MVTVRYAPGTAHLVVTGGAVVVLDGDVSSGLPAEIWREVAAGRGLASVLQALTGAFGTTLSAIPPFVVAVADPDGVRIAIRGDITVTVHGVAAPVTLTGAGVTTWSEQVVADVSRTDIMLPGGGLAEAVLPLRDGVARAGALVAEWGPDASPGPAQPPPARAAAAAPTEIIAFGDQAGGPAAPQLEADDETWTPPDATLIPEADDADEPDTPATGIPAPPDNDPLVDETPADAPPADAPPADEPSAVLDTVASVRVRGDHDGETISVAEARRLRDEQAASSGASDEGAVEPLAPPRPAAPGRLRLSTGQEVPLDRTVVIGRRPRSTRVTGTDLPRLIAVASPEQDISRSHLEVRVEGDSMLATDLHSTNGTTLRRAGADPVRLHPGERNVVVPGDVLDLGDGITVAVEAIA